MRQRISASTSAAAGNAAAVPARGAHSREEARIPGACSERCWCGSMCYENPGHSGAHQCRNGHVWGRGQSPVP
jgi:hypothetical protein